MAGLNEGADAVGGASGPAEDSPGFELREGAFAGGSRLGVVAVEPLLVLGLFVVVVGGGAEGGAGTLVEAVGQDEDLAGEAAWTMSCARAVVRS